MGTRSDSCGIKIRIFMVKKTMISSLAIRICNNVIACSFHEIKLWGILTIKGVKADFTKLFIYEQIVLEF